MNGLNWYQCLDKAMQQSWANGPQAINIAGSATFIPVLPLNDKRLAIWFWTLSTNTINLYPNNPSLTVNSFWQLTAGIFGLKISVKLDGALARAAWFAQSTPAATLQIFEVIGPDFDRANEGY